MAASLGRLTLDLVTRISSFTEPLERAERQAEDSTKKIAKSFDAASLAVKALGAVAAGLSVASVMAFAEKFVDAGNDIQKFAKLSNASIQQFQYYAVGADTAGISMESFADKMKDMQDRIGDFQRTGGGPLADFFNDIAPRVGVTIDQFQKLSGPEALQLFYDSLEKAGASTNDMKFYMESIISDSSLLIPLLENGGKGFKQWGDAAQQAGSILSDSMVKDLALAKQNLQILDLQWQGFEAELVNVAVPALKEVVTHMDEVKAVATVLGAYLVGAGTASAAKYVAGIYSKITAIVADIQAEEAAILTAQRKATAELNAANAEMSAARAAVANAEAKVAADRQVIASEIQRIESSIAQTNAEKALEAQRLRSQITDQGRNATLTRMAELQRVQASMTAELTVLEQRLAATTVAGSAEYVAARTAQTAATERLTVATSANNVAQAASVRTGVSLLGLLGGPVGLGLTVAAVAASYVMLKDNTKDTANILDTQGQSVDELCKKYEKLNSIQKDTVIHELTKQVEELRVKYVTASSDLSAYIGYMEDSGRVSENVAKQIQDQYAKYSQGEMSAVQFYEAVKSINGVSGEQATKMRDLVSASDGAKSAYQQQKDVLNQLNQKNDEAAKKQKQHADATNNTAAAYVNLTQKQMEYVRGVEKTLARQKYIENQVNNNGMSVEMANHFADSREAAGLGFSGSKNDVMPAAVRQATIKSWDAKNYTLSKTELASFSKVQANAAKYNFADKESLYGLPSGLLSAIMMNESRGDTYRNGKLLTSESGAQGSFQFLPATAKRFNVDVASVESSAAGAAKYLQYLYKRFGDWDSAIAAYHAGEGNVERGTNIGPRTRGYVKNANKWVAAANNKTEVDQSILMPTQGDLLAQQKAAAEATKIRQDKELELRKKYYTQEQQLAQDNKDAIEAINSTLTGSDQTNALAKQAALYKSQLTTLHAQEKEEYNQLHAFETDRIQQIKDSYAVKQQLMDADLTKSKAQREDAKAALGRQMQAEIDAVKREEEQQVQSAFEAYLNETEIVVRRYAVERDEIQKNYQLTKETREKLLQANAMGIFSIRNQADNNVGQYEISAREYLLQKKDSASYAAYDLQNQYGSALSGLNSAYANQQSGIQNDPLMDQQQIEQSLLAAHEQYLQSKQALDEEYDEKVKELAQSQQDTVLNTYSNILSQASTVWSSMTDLVKDSAGESSTAYKVMYFGQQQIAAAQATINAFLAYSNVLANAPYPLNMTLAPIALGLGMANVGLIEAQAIAAFATGGHVRGAGTETSDSIPAWLSNNEYVFKASTVRSLGVDTLDYINETGKLPIFRAEGGSVGSSSSSVTQKKYISDVSDMAATTSESNSPIKIYVSVDSSGASTTGAGTNEQKQLGTMIGNAVRTVIMQEQRQGGLLAKR
ncbi:transglycosylase SLT domain-containing protein [Acinetobacter brisouii]|uniref:transglycosylase SLT domain-containing protein n=1 Tax=Acinetobacter brisouii TaxID=396323 RepID=UPI001250B0F4|nr:transglycosylase SLT domain-containing protein [Acinetobacter brisouii]